MTTDASRHKVQLSLRLPGELKETIEDAAAYAGQSVSEFAVNTLAQTARSVLRQHHVTRLSQRDRDVFMAVIDDVNARPNKALRDVAKRYTGRV